MNRNEEENIDPSFRLKGKLKTNFELVLSVESCL